MERKIRVSNKNYTRFGGTIKMIPEQKIKKTLMTIGKMKRMKMETNYIGVWSVYNEYYMYKM